MSEAMNYHEITIKLCDEGSSRNHFTVTASFDKNRLTIKGHDFGLAPLRKWGANEYVYRYSFDSNNTKLLLDSLAVPGADPVTELKQRLTGTSACTQLREYCNEHHISYQFDNATIYSENDRRLVREDKPSEVATFVSLQHAFDIEKEYRSHPTPRNTYQGPYQGLSGRSFLIAYFKDHGITDEEIEWYGRWGGFPNNSFLANAKGLQYAEQRTKCIIGYRSATVEDIHENRCTAPWEWRYAKDFQKVSCLERIPDNIPVKHGIYLCFYQNEYFYFGIAKEEAPITEDMRQNGKWYVYTWAD